MTLAWNLNPALSPSMDLSIQPLQVLLNLFLSPGPLSCPTLGSKPSWRNPLPSLLTPLPLRITEALVQITACTARVKTTDKTKNLTKKENSAEVVPHYLIGSGDMATIYISPDAYCGAFKEELILQKFNFTNHQTAGLHFIEKDNCLLLASIGLSTPAAQIPHWPYHIQGAWLIKINGTPVSTIHSVLQEPRSNQGQKVLLLDFYLPVTCELETS
jgi:hypothetical protein